MTTKLQTNLSRPILWRSRITNLRSAQKTTGHPLGLSSTLPLSSLNLHPWPITHHSSPPTFYPLPLIIKLAAAVVLWIYYSPNVAYRTCPGQAPAKTFIKKSAQKYSFMQNKPNFPRFCAKNSYLEEKQTQFKPNQTQFFTSFFLPILPVLSKAEGPIHPIQTQFQTRIDFTLYSLICFSIRAAVIRHIELNIRNIKPQSPWSSLGNTAICRGAYH